MITLLTGKEPDSSMCGIFGYIGNQNDAYNRVLSGLKSLEYRGYDSWGIAFLPYRDTTSAVTGVLSVKKNTGKISEVEKTGNSMSYFALGHTRWATHGGVTRYNAHPHTDCSGTIAVIHNGIIENYDSLKNSLSFKHKFLSQTDTEVAVHLIEEQYLRNGKNEHKDKGNFLKAVQQSFISFTGLNAIIAMDALTKTFVAAKNGSPLVLGKSKNSNYIASDAHALIPYTEDVYFMNDGEIALIDGTGIEVFSLSDLKKKSVVFQKLDWDVRTVTKGNFPHFMLKEIHDQPRAIENIAGQKKEQLEKLADLVKKSYGTYLVGCGTAAYACLAGTYLFSKIAKRHINFSVGSEFSYLVDFLTHDSLVLALSQSGETIDVIEAAKKAKEKGATLGSLVNVLGSTLYRMADFKILLEAGVEQAVVSTKAFTAKLAHLLMLAYCMTGETATGQLLLKKAAGSVRAILRDESVRRIKALAKNLAPKQHIYIIGRGLSYPIALETALKIKEASYIHAEGFAAGELKHGVIALIEKKTPCIAFLPNDETYGANLAGAMEMKARGGTIIGISYKPHEVFDEYIPFTDDGIASIISEAVIGQLLGYHISVAKGLDPDKPRNLAKSVTVK